MVEVRKPGRPLSSCPHPTGTCSCERIVINYTIPKSSECACPSERAQPTATISGNSRIQKHRRKSTAVNIASLEKAIRADQDAETDASSVTRAPTERSGSHEATPQSSASSTPRLLPTRSESISSCCKPAPVQAPVQSGGCCGVKVEKVPEPEPPKIKSCCSGPKTAANMPAQPPQNIHQPYQQQGQYQFDPKLQAWHNLQQHSLPQAAAPFSFGAPIYNHAAAAYQQSVSSAMSPMMNGPIPSQISSPPLPQQAPEHNCHCGDSCSCFGCAAHPNNATMMEYVRLMAEFQYTGGFGTLPPPLYDMPTYPHHPGYGAEANRLSSMNAGFAAMSTAAPTHMVYQGSIDMPISLLNSSMVASAPWSPPISAGTMSGSQFMEPSGYTTSDSMVGQVPLKTEAPPVSSIADIPYEATEAETPTLSPSSYFWNQMVLPGCNDATGTCQCGDGCECVGCLTHGGHNGVPLEPATNHEHNAFPDFHHVDRDLHLDGVNDFVNINAAPT